MDNKRAGFTLVELLLVIMVLTLIGAVVMPRMRALRDRALDAMIVGRVERVRAAIMVYHARELARGYDRYPPSLERPHDPRGILFDRVMGVLQEEDREHDVGWMWDGTTQGKSVYTAPNFQRYTYDPQRGTFQ